jgi:hypothetical protein
VEDAICDEAFARIRTSPQNYLWSSEDADPTDGDRWQAFAPGQAVARADVKVHLADWFDIMMGEGA